MAVKHKMHPSVLLLTLMAVISCSAPPGKTEQDPAGNSDITRSRTKPASSYADTIEISSLSAVFYSPDSVQLERIKAVTDTSIFKSIMHDCFYQMRNARMVIKKYYPGVKIIEIRNARYLLFNKNGSPEYIDLDKKNDQCGLFLSDGHQPPRLVDMTNIDSELGFYFKTVNHQTR